MNSSHPVVAAHIVPGHPHILLAPERSPGWTSLRKSYQALAADIAAAEADVLLVYSTGWVSVIGHQMQADPNPRWLHVDPNWYELGDMPYDFRVDAAFGHAYAAQARAVGLEARTVSYHGFPIDTGTVVALTLANAGNRLPASIVSCNMYSEKKESVLLGQAAARALWAEKKRAVVLCVTSLSSRYEVSEIDPAQDRISSLKDDEWNRKVLELLGEGRLEDVSQVAREFAHQANADMRFKAIWWLAGLLGQHNRYRGRVRDYQPVWGTGAALVSLEHAEKELAHKEFDDVPDVDVSAGAGSARGADGPVFVPGAPKPVGTYPHARRVGNMLFLSGIGPRSPLDNSIPEGAEAQSRAVIENIKSILAAAGSSLERVVDVTAYLTHMERDFAAFNKVYAEHFAAIQPTRTTVEVGSLPTAIDVELKVVATC